jgi:2-keto-4-pentenoate hydratase/2-oxohepta-3-ene-1,7-dioic acid hydratase in catechol pathway
MHPTRRTFLETATAAAAGAVAGCTLPSVARDTPNVMFAIEPSLIPVLGSAQQFPVRRIYCVGRNYAAHAREMGSDPTREPPFFFQKPTDAIQLVPKDVTVDHPYPSVTKNYHYEVELVAAIGNRAATLPWKKHWITSSATRWIGYDTARLAAGNGRWKKPWKWASRLTTQR